MVLHPSGSFEISPSREDIAKKRLAFPLNLAVHNLERGSLHDARIEVTYPQGLKVQPEGDPKIDPAGRALIYEHQLRSLEPVGSFTPLDTIDTIYFPADYLKFFDVSVSPSGPPYYVEAVSPVLQPDYVQHFRLGIKFFAAGRPVKVGTIDIAFTPTMDVYADMADIDFNTTSLPQDVAAISRSFQSKSVQVLGEWVGTNGSGQRVSYRKVSRRGGRYQLIRVDRGPTRIIADTNSDGFVDFDLNGTPGTSRTTRMVPIQRVKTKDWRPPITEVTVPNGKRYRIRHGPS